MRQWIGAAVWISLFTAGSAQAQPSLSPPPGDFLQKKFDADKLRESIVFPITGVQLGVKFSNTTKDDDLPSIAEIEKKLVGDERDADWLLKLGHALTNAKSDRAKAAYEKSAAAFRKRLDADPKNPQRYLDWIDALSALERHEDVFNAARKCVDLDPKNARAWSTLGFCYWHEFNRLIYGSDKVSWQAGSNQPPPAILRALAPADKARAQTLLNYILHCERERKRHAPDDLDNLMQSTLMGAHWEIFDTYFRTGDWNVNTQAFQAFMSNRMAEALTEHGRAKGDPGALGTAAMILHVQLATELRDPDWSFAKATPAQKKPILALVAEIDKLTGSTDVAIAAKAHFARALIAFMHEDVDAIKHNAARSLALVPREKAAVDLMYRTQMEMPDDKIEAFWSAHSAKHPTARIWEHFAVKRFRAKDYVAAQKYVDQGLRIEPGSRNLWLAQAAIHLKQSPKTLADAGKLLDALEKRLDDAPEKCLIVVEDSPKFADSYRYLRAMHTALSGDWEKGRAQLVELKSRDVLTEPISEALAAFPSPPIILPVQKLGPSR